MLERQSERIESIPPGGTEGAWICDLSKTGISCFSPTQKEKDSFVVVKINDLLLRAKVIYCQPREKGCRLGLQFWNVLPDRQNKLDDLVGKYSKGVPVTCSILEETDSGTPQDTKRIITGIPDSEKKHG